MKIKKLIKKILMIFLREKLYEKLRQNYYFLRAYYENNLSLRRYQNRKKIPKKIFIMTHVPRSGGTYVKNLINYHFGRIIEFNNFKKIELKGINLRKPYFILGHQIFTQFDDEEEKDIYKFVILRNPSERVISRYLYLKNFNLIKEKKKDNIVNLKNLNLNDYLKQLLSERKDNLFTRMIVNKIENSYLDENDFENAISILKKIKVVFINDLENFLKEIFRIDFFNINHENVKNSSLKEKIEINKETEENLNKVNHFDDRIYDYFKD